MANPEKNSPNPDRLRIIQLEQELVDCRAKISDLENKLLGVALKNVFLDRLIKTWQTLNDPDRSSDSELIDSR